MIKLLKNPTLKKIGANVQNDYSSKKFIQKLTPYLFLSKTFSQILGQSIKLGPIVVKNLASEGHRDIIQKVLGDLLTEILRGSGPVFIKLGQILSTRTDLLSKPLAKKLESLYDKQRPMNKNTLQKIIKSHFNPWPFKKFDYHQIGAGSIGQVHKAILKSGEHVVVKVRRPNVENDIKRDFEVIFFYTKILQKISHKNTKTMTSLFLKFLKDLKSSMVLEADFRYESKNIKRFTDKIKRRKDIYAPKLYQNLSNAEILVMEKINGTPLNKLKRNDKEIAGKVLKEFFHQVFIDGDFHGDPHAGNMIKMPDGRLALIDFGLTGTFGKKERNNLAKAVAALIKKDPKKVLKALLSFGEVPSKFNQNKFTKDIKKIIEQYKGKELKSKATIKNVSENLEAFVNQLFRTAHLHGIFVPRNTVILIKGLITIEGVAKSLDPEINTINVAKPIILKSIMFKWWPFS